VQFADDLITGRGHAIVEAWKALAGEDSAVMRAQALSMRKLATQKLTTGRFARPALRRSGAIPE